MGSNLATIHQQLIYSLSNVSSVVVIDDSLASPDDWVKQYLDPGHNRTPAIHLSPPSVKVQPYSTDSDLLTEAEHKLTLVFPIVGSSASTLASITDDIISTVCSDETLGGNCELLTINGPELTDVYGEYHLAELVVTTTHTWTP